MIHNKNFSIFLLQIGRKSDECRFFLQLSEQANTFVTFCFFLFSFPPYSTRF